MLRLWKFFYFLFCKGCFIFLTFSIIKYTTLIFCPNFLWSLCSETRVSWIYIITISKLTYALRAFEIWYELLWVFMFRFGNECFFHYYMSVLRMNIGIPDIHGIYPSLLSCDVIHSGTPDGYLINKTFFKWKITA